MIFFSTCRTWSSTHASTYELWLKLYPVNSHYYYFMMTLCMYWYMDSAYASIKFEMWSIWVDMHFIEIIMWILLQLLSIYLCYIWKWYKEKGTSCHFLGEIQFASKPCLSNNCSKKSLSTNVMAKRPQKQ